MYKYEAIIPDEVVAEIQQALDKSRAKKIIDLQILLAELDEELRSKRERLNEQDARLRQTEQQLATAIAAEAVLRTELACAGEAIENYKLAVTNHENENAELEHVLAQAHQEIKELRSRLWTKESLSADEPSQEPDSPIQIIHHTVPAHDQLHFCSVDPHHVRELFAQWLHKQSGHHPPETRIKHIEQLLTALGETITAGARS